MGKGKGMVNNGRWNVRCFEWGCGHAATGRCTDCGVPYCDRHSLLIALPRPSSWLRCHHRHHWNAATRHHLCAVDLALRLQLLPPGGRMAVPCPPAASEVLTQARRVLPPPIAPSYHTHQTETYLEIVVDPPANPLPRPRVVRWRGLAGGRRRAS